MKVLILYNFFNYQNKFLPKIIKKLLKYYNSSKLNSIISQIRKDFSYNVDITVLTPINEELKLKSKISLKFLPKLRVEIDRLIFRGIKDDVVQKTKQTLKTLYSNLLDLQIYSLKGTFLPKIFEFELSLFLNEFFGKYELIKKIIQEREYDEIYLCNINNRSLDFFKKINSDMKLFNDNFFLKNANLLNGISTIHYLLITLGLNFKRILFKKQLQSNYMLDNKKKNILFFANSDNQIKSIMPIYTNLQSEKLVNPVKYSSETFTSTRSLTQIIKYILQVRRILKCHKRMIARNLNYDSINLGKFLEIYYLKGHLVDLIRSYNVLQNFIEFNKKFHSSLVIIPNDYTGTMRLITNFCKLKKIPTLFIPHAAIPIIEEMVTKNDIKYFALGGNYDKEYYIQKGVDSENIEITGVPRYEYFYKNEFIKLSEVRDMFDGRKHNFTQHKLTVLLTTNPIDDESNEKIIKTVLKSLKQLKIENQLIIKLHPRENGLIHRKICRELKLSPIIIKNYQILNVIKSCDILISQKSTTILEAMIVGTPVICLDVVNKSFRETSKYLFLDEKYVYMAYNQDELTEHIRNLITNKERLKDYIKKLKTNAEKFIFYDINNPPIKKISELIAYLD